MPNPSEVTRRTALTDTLWKESFGDLHARMNALESANADIDPILAELLTVGLQRLNEVILPINTEILALLAQASVAWADALAQLEQLNTGGLPANLVIESAERVFISNALKAGLPATFSADVISVLAAADKTALKAFLDIVAVDASAAALLAAIKTVDGDTSGLDADLLRGQTPGATGLALLIAANATAARAALGLAGGALLPKGGASALRAYTTDAIVTGDAAAAAAAPVAVTFGSPWTFAWTDFITAELGAMTANLVIENPTGVVPGTSRSIWLLQDATGNRTVTFGSNFKGPVPTIRAAANAYTLLVIHARTATHLVAVATEGS